jgi:hypothetical protein
VTFSLPCDFVHPLLFNFDLNGDHDDVVVAGSSFVWSLLSADCACRLQRSFNYRPSEAKQNTTAAFLVHRTSIYSTMAKRHQPEDEEAPLIRSFDEDSSVADRRRRSYDKEFNDDHDSLPSSCNNQPGGLRGRNASLATLDEAIESCGA